MDASTRRKLASLRRALFDAIADSDEVNRRLDDLRAEGFSLYLLVDGSSHRDEPSEAEVDQVLREEIERRRAGLPPHAGLGPKGRLQLAARPSGPPPEEPAFRINGADVDLLRSLGIDPTRKARRRRKESGR